MWNENQILKALSSWKTIRLTIYLHESRVDNCYRQCVGGITEITQSAKLIGKIKASLLQVFGSESGGENETSGRRNITAIEKAGLIECEREKSGQLVDLSFGHAQARGLVRYIGASQIAGIEHKVNAEPPLLARVMEDERARQEETLGRQIVWWASVQGRTLASIASFSSVNPDHNYCYGSCSNLGILGHFEKEVDGVIFITPLWIWADS